MGLLRKPDFQRETNHWTPEQIASLITSFLDNELVPSIILWKSKRYIFVIDGSHRLSAVRAWIENDYGDGSISRGFYGGEITQAQVVQAKRSREIVENKVGRFKDYEQALTKNTYASPEQQRRAGRLFTRGLTLQWVQGSPSAAETSFFKINSQGTPLDTVEETLLRHRRKPVAIAARAIVRAGTGNKYWSAFTGDHQRRSEQIASELSNLLFRADPQQPVRSIDVPLGGSASASDALSLLIDLLIIADTASAKSTLDASQKAIGNSYSDDLDGKKIIAVLEKALRLTRRFTGNEAASFGLHSAVYFYNDRGRHSRFLFLGMALLLAEKLKNNDTGFFQKFTRARGSLENLLIEQKAVIMAVVSNTNKNTRVNRVRDLLDKFVGAMHAQLHENKEFNLENVLREVGIQGKILDVSMVKAKQKIDEDTKLRLFFKKVSEQQSSAQSVKGCYSRLSLYRSTTSCVCGREV